MSETRQLTGERGQVTACDDGTSVQGGSSLAALTTLPPFLADPALAIDALGRRILEWGIDSLGFERGFLVVRVSGAGAEDDFRVVSSRRRQGDGWEDAVNAEFAVNRSLVQRALAATEPVYVDDCLVPGSPSDQTSHQSRTVLAVGVHLSEEGRGVLYFDRELGQDALEPALAADCAVFVEACSPALGRSYLELEIAALRQELSSDENVDEEVAPAIDDLPDFHGIIGRDEKLHKIFQVVEKIKDSGLNVCVFGESGTGKELIARAIHGASTRSTEPFVSENCGAISETLLESELFGHMKGSFTGADEDKQGLFQTADKGTLFLDEIGDMSEGMQRKLLRTLQEGTIRPIGSKSSIRVDVRVVCASNRDLKHLVREGSFRADLYYRLNVIQIEMPPLRDRRGDIPLLIEHVVNELAETEGLKKRLSESAMRALCQYSWPGNVRELRNVLRRVFLTSTRRVVARKDVLPFLSNSEAATCLGENVDRDEDTLILRIPMRQRFNDIIDQCERIVLLNALKEHGWNKSRVTKALGIPRQSLYNKIAKYDLQKSWEGESSEG